MPMANQSVINVWISLSKILMMAALLWLSETPNHRSPDSLKKIIKLDIIKNIIADSVIAFIDWLFLKFSHWPDIIFAMAIGPAETPVIFANIRLSFAIYLNVELG
jgi:hypothetical protein